ncbi:hypothetical protein GCM10010214_16920 [Streptomyces abikoensis]|nr:hypothetical protein GCM10010214_16920 [Streptomyces abikoensis]
MPASLAGAHTTEPAKTSEVNASAEPRLPTMHPPECPETLSPPLLPTQVPVAPGSLERTHRTRSLSYADAYTFHTAVLPRRPVTRSGDCGACGR